MAADDGLEAVAAEVEQLRQIAAVLRDHEWRSVVAECRCGFLPKFSDPGPLIVQHRNHLAAALAAALAPIVAAQVEQARVEEREAAAVRIEDGIARVDVFTPEPGPSDDQFRLGLATAVLIVRAGA